jgi:hypothetical protein
MDAFTPLLPVLMVGLFLVAWMALGLRDESGAPRSALLISFFVSCVLLFLTSVAIDRANQDAQALRQIVAAPGYKVHVEEAGVRVLSVPEDSLRTILGQQVQVPSDVQTVRFRLDRVAQVEAMLRTEMPGYAFHTPH